MVARGKSKAQIRAEDRIAAVVNSSARASRSTPKRRQVGVPDVYQDMLSEASSLFESDTDKAPRKRRLESQDPEQSDLEAGVLSARKKREIHGPSTLSVIDHSDSDVNALQRPQQVVEDSGESDEDDIDWEEVGFDQVEPANDPGIPIHDGLADISVEVGPQKTPRKTVMRRKPVTTAEKLMRLAVHEAHVLFLIFHVHVRNSWCNLSAVQSKLKQLLPLRTIALLHPNQDLIQFSRSENFINGLKFAVELWRAKFRVTESGMQRSRWADGPDDIKRQISCIADETTSVDKEEFIKRAKTLRGSQDDGNQLFCALLRSVGVETRLVCSLQPLPFGTAIAKLGTPVKGKTTIYAEGHSDGATSAEEGYITGSASESSKTPKGRRRRIGQPNFAFGGSSKPPPAVQPQKKVKSSPVRRLEYPVFWVEAFDSAYQRWVPVDASVTGTINKPAKLEPPASYSQNTLSYVIAFDDHGYARDVTRRYAKAFNAKTRKMRIESTENGDRWWRKALKPFRNRQHTNRDQVEDAELAKREAQEGLPNNVQDFKDHPYYALERHIRRHEVIFPKREVGKVNAGKSSSSNVESVYRRSDVQIVRSADKWYRVGREIKPGQQPLKHVPARRGTRIDDDAEDETPMTALYAYSQTSLYTPPPVVGGRIPKNAYGNLDVYVSSMVPPGAVHIRHNLAARAAKVLNIDFADAVTGFTFKGRIGEAVKSGVVVASEYEEAMIATIEGFEDAAQQEADAKRSIESLRLWRRFLTGLRIGVRLGLYGGGNDGQEASQGNLDTVRKKIDEAEDKQEEAIGAGGFFPDAAEETVPTVSRFAQTARPRSLLARAQEEADANSEDDTGEQAGEDAPEDFQESAPRKRRQRKVTFEESEVEGDDDSADDFVPDMVRPTPSRRKRGKMKDFETEKSHPDQPVQAGTRRSGRQTRSMRSLVEKSSTDEIEDGIHIPEAITADPCQSGGSFLTDDAQDNAIDSGGGFIPETPKDNATLSGGGFIPDHLSTNDLGGGFISEEDIAETGPTASHPSAGYHDGEVQGGGFILENHSPDTHPITNAPDFADRDQDMDDADNVTASPSQSEHATSPHSRQPGEIKDAVQANDGSDGDLDEQKSSKPQESLPGGHEDISNKPTTIDEDQNLASDIDDDDRGSLLSHDPEDEDAEPEWLNSD